MSSFYASPLLIRTEQPISEIHFLYLTVYLILLQYDIIGETTKVYFHQIKSEIFHVFNLKLK